MNYNEVAPRFRSRRAYINEWQKEAANIASRGEHSRHEMLIKQLISKGGTLYDVLGIVGRLYTLTLADLRYQFAVSLSDEKLKTEEIHLALMKYFLSAQVSFFNFERQGFISQSGEDNRMRPTTIFFSGQLVAFVAVFANQNFFHNCVKFVLDQFDIGAVSGTEKPLAPLFMIRLAEKFIGISPRDWEVENKPWSVNLFTEEPLFAELWQHWDTEDMELIHSLLIQLANRHTFTASRNNKDGSRDFAAHAEQYPIDLHFIMRLREWRGLANPEIKHRLTEPPFDRLPEPIETIELPDELHQVMKKTREVIPDFDAVINAAKTRDWQMLL
ncbi:hypothetical protein [Cellvibrio sp. UBA7671]|uniref:hypothetical protein n=1 Tax=Cellvibrio sp. UBA7671 TaxID=1946312 RepID=UPI002F35C408